MEGGEGILIIRPHAHAREGSGAEDQKLVRKLVRVVLLGSRAGLPKFAVPQMRVVAVRGLHGISARICSYQPAL